MRAEVFDGAADRRIDEIAAEVSRLSGMLDDLATRSAAPSVRRPEEPRVAPAPLSFQRGRARAVRDLIQHRRKRERFFAADLFADPAWDMLLDLYAAHYEARCVAVSSLCIAAAVPATTALRWIRTMEERGHFVRAPDPHDGRRIYIGLSEAARRALDAYFDDIAG